MSYQFDKLKEFHDGKGREILKREWEKLGGIMLPDGMEENRNRIASELKTDSSPHSLAIRHRADMVLKYKDKTWRASLKTEYKNQPNYTIQADSLEVAIGENSIILCVDAKETVKWCYASEVPVWRIYVPRPRDLENMKRKWPDAEIKEMKVKGSGTSFLYLHKSSKVLKPLSDLVNT